MNAVALKLLVERKRFKWGCVIASVVMFFTALYKIDFVDIRSAYIGAMFVFIVMTILDIFFDSNKKIIDFLIKEGQKNE